MCALKDVPLFRGVDDKKLSVLANVMEARSVRKGKSVVKAAESGQFVMFVMTGELRVVLSSRTGKEYIVDKLGPGDFFGELALLTGMPRSADVEASDDSTILILSQHDFERYVLDDRALTRALLRELALRLRETTTKAGDLALLDVYRRIARVLASLADKDHLEEGVIGIIKKLPTHREIAALAATTREMVTRALKELQEAGHIKFQAKKLLIKSLPL